MGLLETQHKANNDLDNKTFTPTYYELFELETEVHVSVYSFFPDVCVVACHPFPPSTYCVAWINIYY
jgi:hypothetical protein